MMPASKTDGPCGITIRRSGTGSGPAVGTGSGTTGAVRLTRVYERLNRRVLFCASFCGIPVSLNSHVQLSLAVAPAFNGSTMIKWSVIRGAVGKEWICAGRITVLLRFVFETSKYR